MTDPTPEQMIEMLNRHRSIFTGYARNHRDKVPKLKMRLSQTKDTSTTADKLRDEIDGTIAKAVVNEQHAADITKLIGPPETVRSPDTKPVDQG